MKGRFQLKLTDEEICLSQLECPNDPGYNHTGDDLERQPSSRVSFPLSLFSSSLSSCPKWSWYYRASIYCG
jgi:hypothetical protein